MMNRTILNKDGISLVELLVALVILLLVLSIAYPLYAFGDRSFKVGSRQSIIQQNARMAADYITRELRYATNVKIYTDTSAISIPSPIPSDNEYNYIVIDGNTIKHLSKNGQVIIPQGLSDGIEFELEFDQISSNMIQITVTGKQNGQVYDIVSEFNLLNTSSLNDHTGSVIEYKKLPPTVIRLIPFNTETGIEPDSQLSIEFNQSISPLDLSGITLVGIKSGDVSVSAVRHADKPNIIIINHDMLEKGEKCTVEVPAGTVENDDGIVNEAISWEFITIYPPPELTTIEYNDDASIEIIFDQDIKQKGNLKDVTIDGVNVEEAWIEEGKLFLIPEVVPDESYILTIPKDTVANYDGVGNEDICEEGIALEPNYKTPIKVSSQTPAPGAYDVQNDTVIIISFDQEIYPLNLGAISLTNSSGEELIIEVGLEEGDNTLYITTDEILDGDYTVYIPTGVVKNADDVQNYKIVWTFSTRPDPATTE